MLFIKTQKRVENKKKKQNKKARNKEMDHSILTLYFIIMHPASAAAAYACNLVNV